MKRNYIKNFELLHNEKTNAVLLIHKNHCDLSDYQRQGYKEVLYEGNKNECTYYVSQWFEENFIPDEMQIFLTAA